MARGKKSYTLVEQLERTTSAKKTPCGRSLSVPRNWSLRSKEYNWHYLTPYGIVLLWNVSTEPLTGCANATAITALFGALKPKIPMPGSWTPSKKTLSIR